MRHWHASPRAPVVFFIHAALTDTGLFGHRRSVTLRDVSATVGEQIEALRRIAGNDAVALIRRVPNPAIAAIVAGWLGDFDAARARAVGFRAEADFDEIICTFIEDEMKGGLESV